MQCDDTTRELVRLSELQRYNILDTPPEDSFDCITRLARTVLGTPIVTISLTDHDRQWFKSKQGLEVTETPRAISFCTHAIEQNDAFIVPDALEHPLFNQNPLVTGEPHIRFYAGVPLTISSGHKIGTLCAIDRRPRELSGDQIDALRDLARLVVGELELRQIATNDILTGAFTQLGFGNEIKREFDRAKRYCRDLSVIMLDLDNFKAVNERFGFAVGDMMLKAVHTQLTRQVRNVDIIGRLGADEFAVALPETAVGGAQILAERIRQRIADTLVETPSGGARITASIATVGICETDVAWVTMMDRATAALHHAKTAGSNWCAPGGATADIHSVA